MREYVLVQYYEGDADDEGRGRARQRRRGEPAGGLMDDPERQGDAREQLRTRGQFKVGAGCNRPQHNPDRTLRLLILHIPCAARAQCFAHG